MDLRWYFRDYVVKSNGDGYAYVYDSSGNIVGKIVLSSYIYYEWQKLDDRTSDQLLEYLRKSISVDYQ